MRSSRSCLASRSSLSSSRERFWGRSAIIWSGTSQRPHAPAPCGDLAGLLRSCPSHFRILADKLRVTCISTSLPPPSAQWPVRSTRKERLGKRNGSRLPRLDPEAARSVCRRASGIQVEHATVRACSSGALASITPMISGDRALKIEKQLAQLLDVEVDELRDYLAGNIRTSSTRRTGFRFVRGTHGGHYVRDREGTDIRPAGVSVR